MWSINLTLILPPRRRHVRRVPTFQNMIIEEETFNLWGYN